MTKGQQFAEWYRKMDWEGGVAELVQYGDYDSGDLPLDNLLDELNSLLQAINSRINELVKKYGDDMYDED